MVPALTPLLWFAIMGLARYIVRASTEFAAAHALHGYEGGCSRIHGHNFKVEIEVEASVLDGIGMAIDFTRLESLAESIAQTLDHRMLNEVPPFDEMNPTAENLGAYFWIRALKALSDDPAGEHARSVRLRSVTVRENDRTSVTYTEL